MTQQSMNENVAEGDLPPGQRPQPGPRPPREVWLGDRGDEGRTAAESGLWTSATPVVTAPPRSTSAPRQGAATRNVSSADGRRTTRRIMGVDVARGFALVGMIAVHVLPAVADVEGNPSLEWRLFAGHSAALFATLAGVSLAFMTGGRNPRRGRDGTRARVSILVRALVLFLIGLSINLLELPVYNILIYYGLMFLVAIPFTLLSVRWLLVSSAVFAVVMPFVMQWSLSVLPAHVYGNPGFAELLTDPGAVLAELFLTGTYPALPWMTFICLGMALGRLPLSRDRVQVVLVIVGAVVAAAARGISMLMLMRFDLENALIEATPWMTSDDVWNIQVYGPDPQLPDTSYLWLLLSGPHTNTPFALLESAGLAMVALGAFLLLCRVIGKWLTWLGAMGSMTLTLYVSHLVLLAFVWTETTPWFWFIVQVVVAALFAVAWQQAVGNGPLERLVTRVSKGAAAAVVPPEKAPPRRRAQTPRR
ncbi:DUF1624 domain-containing protein [Kocuria rhizophila]|uniref:DUF1624 domain-containing protein n=2 Tax=Kocuria TaxID=57493 RepID=A0AAX2SFN2_KOCRH|nr:heparan-alpha-glucosaminide N-acetyltransferase domain-containing protein [Kocuria rhizophila]WIW68650.1 heparan-alpha-glucosaminide N-acetyltransferase domain-containing protein [Kocuria sp. ChxB]KIC69672.1 hypothetical protein RK09_04855 [Kocuria rhizophila]KUP27650.1 hypothetical protein IX41_05640 [Kocuria rhizophila]MCR4525928.1 DUF1624 domain-containing protein [Kocuria rhizophila]MCT1546282.1 DUF1624 domain-containing protein [Kocuria rhizophila]